jgi:hypothetical protein
MRSLILISVMLIGLTLPSVAQIRSYIGFAKTSCVTWTKERSNQYSIMSLEMQRWATGFLSGANAASSTFKDRLEGIDADAVYAWLDNYCRQNPLEIFPEAVSNLSRELANRAGRQ